MDPVTALFSAYVNHISHQITNNYRGNVNLDVTPVRIKYKDSEINFQHQIWSIKDNSVCADLLQDATEYSQCTMNAKSLFKEICNSLSKKKNKQIKESKYQRMYCNAAIKYQPMVATISSSTKRTGSDLEKRCNLLILNSMGSKDKKLKEERDEICNLTKNK
tara:strand:+ start:1956 stop:2441 length:486 start_codon:yes stop_codon:yes gene_type:complete